VNVCGNRSLKYVTSGWENEIVVEHPKVPESHSQTLAIWCRVVAAQRKYFANAALFIIHTLYQICSMIQGYPHSFTNSRDGFEDLFF
jgi:hypothetical protein